MLQRIYGTAWESKAALDEHLHRLEEAEKRDHRKLATELDLLSFPHELGGGLAVWHPKGAIVRKLMEDYSRERHDKGGYQFVFTPHLANGNLFETSGHLDFYKDGMYPPMEMDNGTYYMKPMNCPMHCLIFRSRQRSYRELPLRLVRARHGVPLRACRHVARADAHPRLHAGRQPHLLHGGSAAGRDRLAARLRDERAAGVRLQRLHGQPVDQGSRRSTSATTRSGRRPPTRCAPRWCKYGLPYKVKEGDAAFYGPKIDIDVQRRHRPHVAAQHDPVRLQPPASGSSSSTSAPTTPATGRSCCTAPCSARSSGSSACSLEHYAGAFPTWMAPVQARVLPVAEAHQALRRRGRRPAVGRGLPRRHRRRQRSTRQAHPHRQAGEAAVRARRRRRRRRRRHRRREPARRRGRARRRRRRRSSTGCTPRSPPNSLSPSCLTRPACGSDSISSSNRSVGSAATPRAWNQSQMLSQSRRRKSKPCGLPTRSTACGRSISTSRPSWTSTLYGDRSPCVYPASASRPSTSRSWPNRAAASSRSRPQLGQARRGDAVGVADELHHQLGADQLHRVGHGGARPTTAATARRTRRRPTARRSAHGRRRCGLAIARFSRLRRMRRPSR